MSMHDTRLKFFLLQGGKCFRCQRDCTLLKPSKRRRMFTLDHIIPKRLGGTNARMNLVGMCIGCNMNKGCQMPSKKMLAQVARRNERMGWRHD